VSRTVRTSFVGRRHGTDRGQDAREAREAYRPGKDGRVHEAMTSLALDRDNSRWVVRT